MATRIAETLLAADADLTHIHRRVVRVGAAAAWAAAAGFLVVGFLGDSEAMFLEAVGPILAAGFMTAQIVLQKENGGLALFSAALVTMVMYSVIGNETTIVPASVALVIICSIGMVLIESREIVIVGGVASLLLVIPILWGLPTGEALQLGVVMALGFAMASAIFFTIRNAATTLNKRFQTLFENSPTAVMEEDWSRSIAYLRSEYTGRPDRLREYLIAYPKVVQRAVALAKIVRVNRAAVELLEADSPDELLGLRDENKVTEDTVDSFVGALVSLYEGRSTLESEVLAVTMKGRPIWLQSRSIDTAPSNPGKTVIVGLADITHMKARQEQMADLVRAKDEFIAKVSHELRTPLTAVVGLTSEMSSMEGLSDEERNELMNLVAGQAQEMSYIIEDLLVASKAEMGTIAIDSTVVDLEAALRATIDGLAIPVNEIPETVPTVVADASRVRQILRNLLTNAQRYGGPNHRIAAGALFDKIWLEVRDDGEGVAPGDAERIFKPYGTAGSGVKDSVGLGLSVARQLAELMGGSLTYHRDLGETVFRLELPAAEPNHPVLTSNKASV